MCLKRTPDSADLYYRRGLSRLQLQESEAALQDLSKAIELNGQLADAWYVRGNLYAQQSDQTRALNDYKKAVELNPEHAAAWYNQGNLLYSQNDTEAAVRSWTEALRIQPTMFRAYNNRAAARVHLKSFAEAAEDYEQAIRLSPGFARALDNYAWLLATTELPDLRDPEKAVTLAKRACELTQFQDWSCLSTLAAAHAEAGDLSLAANWAKKALEGAPESEREDLERLIQVYEASVKRKPVNSASTIKNNSSRR